MEEPFTTTKLINKNKELNAQKTLVNIFEEQVEKTPNGTVILFNNNKITYNQLNLVANQFADYLKKEHQIQSEDLIAVKIEKSDRLIVILLGVLKSKGVYIPIDPSHPKERNDFIIKDCKLTIDEAEFEKFQIKQNQFSKYNSTESALPNDLAYIIYTSGTTGKPKGVMIEHYSLTCRIIAETKLLNFLPITCFITNNVFDVSLLEIFLPFNNGGMIVIPSSNVLSSPVNLIDFLIVNEINILQGTPSFINNFLLELSIEKGFVLSKKLQLICIGGESLKDNLVKKLKMKLPFTKINNHYGPTETTIDAIVLENVHEVSHNIIGKPIENTQVYILDDNLKQLSICDFGEIYIGGSGVARGYLNDDLLTYEKFKSNPFIKGDRIYKTGDLGRLLNDGNIEFKGRIDNQVKIRGIRIELGEIEAILNTYKFIDAVIVDIYEFNINEKELVAYIVSKESTNVTEIREFLTQKLPNYMIPSYFIDIDSIPLNSNGKIDKKLLPKPNVCDFLNFDSYIAPRNEIEEKLVGLWSAILGRTKISITDNFFELGGHSLKAMHLLSKINNEMGLNIDLQYIFNLPTIIEFSDNLIINSTTSNLKLKPSEIKAHYECTINQKRLWFIFQLNPLSTTQNESLTLELDFSVNVDTLYKTLKFLITRHETFRTNFITINGEPKQKIHDKINADISLYDLANDEKKLEKIEEIISEKESYPFDLEKDILFSISIFKIGDTNWKVNFVMHHILTDGWSNEILKEEFYEIYKCLNSNKIPNLKILKIQNKDYAEFQKEKLTSEIIETNQKYWHNKLGDEFPIIDLPKDHEYKIHRKNSGGAYRVFINKKLNDKIKNLSNSENISIYTIFLSSINILINKMCRINDIIISSAFSERENEETRGIIGYFISPLMLRSKMNINQSCKEYLKITKNNITDAIKHHDYPIEKLIVELDIQFDYSKYFVSPVSLNMINYTENTLDPSDTKDGYMGDLNMEVEYELDFEVIEYPNFIELRCFYKNELFNKKTIKKVMNSYIEILSQMSENPNTTINNISSSI